MVRLRVALSASLALLTISSLRAYSSDKEQVPTFRSSSRLVVVDVVVTGKTDEAVKDLRAEDFVLTEDGKPQQISGFEAHFVKGTPSATKDALPPNQFTNSMDVPPDAPINILLIDAVNSSFINQASVHSAIVHFLTTLPPRTPMAVFVLSDRLRMVQNFTTDSSVLIKAALAYKPETTEAQIQGKATESARQIVSRMTSQNFSIGDLRNVVDRTPPELRDRYRSMGVTVMLDREEALSDRLRAENTMSAFKQIARAVSGYPGRKNLIWLSGAFPLDVRPLEAERMSTINNENFAIEMREVAQLMTTSKIAIYPVDIRGLEASIVSDEVQTMRVVADETGGKAFFSRNDIEVAMSKAVELGSTYYTVSYAPRNQKWNGKFRDIKIELNRKDVKLAYRKGYYAVDAPRQSKRLEADFQLAMVDESPLATGIMMRTSVLERRKDGTTVIGYAIPGTQLRLRDNDNRPTATKFAFGVMGFDKNGKRVGMGSEVWDLPGDSAVVEKLEREGWVHRQTVKINSEAAFLRVAVQDQTTGKIGTVEIPLEGK